MDRGQGELGRERRKRQGSSKRGEHETSGKWGDVVVRVECHESNDIVLRMPASMMKESNWEAGERYRFCVSRGWFFMPVSSAPLPRDIDGGSTESSTIAMLEAVFAGIGKPVSEVPISDGGLSPSNGKNRKNRYPRERDSRIRKAVQRSQRRYSQIFRR
ncbi:hypothetical protein [Pasteuria penetrans]|uniref:hypothetical protein n=1 Tax=Pasteuria penetrans TaxID=86005 RepID=UPI000FA2C209|nr:hypothetical protein [Pasteuria penetrans]